MPHMNHAFRPEFLATKQLNMLKKKKKKKQHFLAYYCDGTDAAKQILESSIFTCINNLFSQIPQDPQFNLESVKGLK